MCGLVVSSYRKTMNNPEVSEKSRLIAKLKLDLGPPFFGGLMFNSTQEEQITSLTRQVEYTKRI